MVIFMKLNEMFKMVGCVETVSVVTVKDYLTEELYFGMRDNTPAEIQEMEVIQVRSTGEIVDDEVFSWLEILVG
jgi:hypothetical protein